MTKVKVIAEIGCNWETKENFFEMIRKAKEIGCWACKTQLFTEEQIKNHPQFEKLKKMIIDEALAEEFKKFADSQEIPLLFSCMYLEAIDLICKIGVDYIKIREKDSENYALIDKALKTGKTVFVSTRKLPLDPHYLFNPRISWLYCNPSYPPRLSEFELNRVAVFDGFSCHFPNITVPLAAAVMAKAENKKEYYIETHVTLSHEMEVIDSKVSIDFSELKKLMECARMVAQFS